MYRILIVDDEPIIRQGLCKLIEASEVSFASIRSAENGVQALQMIQDDEPHFLFTDIRMPKMDGLDLCKTVSKQYPNIQMVVISGYSDFQYAQKSLAYGVKDYLLKPISKKKLYQVLEKVIVNTRVIHTSVYLSITKLDEWVERMEEAIWCMQSEELGRVMELLKEEYEHFNFPFIQKCELLTEYFNLLIKKLNTRDMFPFVVNLQLLNLKDAQEAFQVFEMTVMSLINDLKEKRKGKVKDPVEEAKIYIDLNLAKEVSLEEVAELLGLSPTYFSQLFKQKTNETFIQYRIKRRIKKAKQLLEISHYRITDISYEIGYADHPHFTKTFKKYEGCSPSEYRKKLGIE